MGHSIGSEIVLQLNRLLTDRTRIVKNFLLFPSIENMGQLEEAKKVSRMFHIKYLLRFIAFVLSLLSDTIKKKLVNYLVPEVRDRKAPNCIADAVIEMVDWRVLRNIGDMAQDEFRNVEQMDEVLLNQISHKLVIIYGYASTIVSLHN